jgi:SAM-dependent methyltransferase
MSSPAAIEAAREKVRPLASPSGRGVIWRSLLDVKLASIFLSLQTILAGVRGDVLEVGCGNQPYRFLFRHASYQAIDHARAKAFISSPRPDVIYYEGETFPVSDESQDFVFHVEVLEHVENPDRFLGECHRVLRPGGRLLFTVPLNYRFHYIPYDYFRYTPSGVRLLLTRAGFRDVSVVPQGTDVTTASHKVLSICFRWLREDVALPWRLLRGLVTIALLPFLAVVHLVGLFSLLGAGSTDDPLGYRVVAYK